MSLSENLRWLRQSAGLSYKNMADIVGTSRQAPFWWEKGIKEPRHKYRVKICEYFGIKESQLFE